MKAADSSETNYYILIANDADDTNGDAMPSPKVAMFRLRGNGWELYQRTPFRTSIKPGDQCLIYLAGKHKLSQHVIAEARVRGVVPSGRVKRLQMLADQPVSYIEFDAIKIYNRPVPIRLKLDFLSFMPENKTKWGASMRSGCRKISHHDFKQLRSD